MADKQLSAKSAYRFAISAVIFLEDKGCVCYAHRDAGKCVMCLTREALIEANEVYGFNIEVPELLKFEALKPEEAECSTPTP